MQRRCRQYAGYQNGSCRTTPLPPPEDVVLPVLNRSSPVAHAVSAAANSVAFAPRSAGDLASGPARIGIPPLREPLPQLSQWRWGPGKSPAKWTI
jgi:hypothetical protein